MSSWKILRFYYALAVFMFVVVIFSTLTIGPVSLSVRLDRNTKQPYGHAVDWDEESQNDMDSDNDNDDNNQYNDHILPSKETIPKPNSNYNLLRAYALTSKDVLDRDLYSSLREVINLLNRSSNSSPDLKDNQLRSDENSEFGSKLGDGRDEKRREEKNQILNLMGKVRDVLVRENQQRASMSSLKNIRHDLPGGEENSGLALKVETSNTASLKVIPTKHSLASEKGNDNLKFNQNRNVNDVSKTIKDNHSNVMEIPSFKENHKPMQKLPWKTDTESLVKILRDRLHVAKNHVQEIRFSATCSFNATVANSCDVTKSCLRMKRPTDAKMRVTQLVGPTKLRLTKKNHNALQQMAEKVSGHYDVIVLTAASYDHYFEVQGLIKSVHDNVLPVVKNMTFIFYDLGLSIQQRVAVEKHCRCQVLDFPFDLFPEFMRNLQCYSWKPAMIKAHVQQAGVLIWADASIRFHTNPEHLSTLIERTRKRGVQVGVSKSASPFRTFQSMYHYFGDEPCLYLEMDQAMATMGFYKRDPFIDRAVLEPWVACAVHQECICALKGTVFRSKDCKQSFQMMANWKLHNGPISYGLCHRFDQSAISLILHKLYQGHYGWVLVNMIPYLDIQRGHRIDYFSTL